MEKAKRDAGAVVEFGNYRLIQRIEAEQIAYEAWLAEQPGEGGSRKVVIRRISPSFVEYGHEHLATFCEEFFTQARLASELSHPNIVQILGLGVCDGEGFVATEHIHGQDLKRVMQRCLELKRRVPPAVALRVVADVCAGLHHIHTWKNGEGNPMGLIHHHISPWNIWISFDGAVKLAGLGIAWAPFVDYWKEFEQHQRMKERFPYVSPEQVRCHSLSPGVDIFSLGVVLYELLTAVSPFKRDSAPESLNAVVLEEPPKPSEVADVSPHLDDLIMCALAKNPEERYADAQAFQTAIEAHLLENGLGMDASQMADWMKELFPAWAQEKSQLGAELSQEEARRFPKTSAPPENVEAMEKAKRDAGAVVEFGNYRLIQRIEAEQIAYEAWLAEQPGEGGSRKVVIRRISPSFVEYGHEHLATFCEEFFTQARLASELSHPNIVQILGLGVCDGEGFVATEHIHGQDLKRVMQRCLELKRRVPPAVALRVVADVCAGLHHIHTWKNGEGNPMGLIHHHISPWNIWISFDGSVKLAGVGIAWAPFIDYWKEFEQHQRMKEGLPYVSPELLKPKQVQGHNSGPYLDLRSDIFSLGVVLYELLTGISPFKRKTEFATLEAIAKEKAPKPSEMADVSPHLDDLIMCALAKNPEERYADAKAFQTAIEAHLLENGLGMDASQMADWMKELFPAWAQEKSQLGAELSLKELKRAETKRMQAERAECAERAMKFSNRELRELWSEAPEVTPIEDWAVSGEGPGGMLKQTHSTGGALRVFLGGVILGAVVALLLHLWGVF
ncbi:MAG: serine/threonine protein kinase [Cystobacterineae bacterium]|nr:serine/threonine protein kinase [Cystobacterineae bacterium]